MVGHPDNGVRQECDAETGTAGAVGGGELIQLQADIWGKAILGTELHGALVSPGVAAGKGPLRRKRAFDGSK